MSHAELRARAEKHWEKWRFSRPDLDVDEVVAGALIVFHAEAGARDRADAERYRWLRESRLEISVQVYGDELALDELDKAIDPFIAASKKENKHG